MCVCMCVRVCVRVRARARVRCVWLLVGANGGWGWAARSLAHFMGWTHTFHGNLIGVALPPQPACSPMRLGMRLVCYPSRGASPSLCLLLTTGTPAPAPETAPASGTSAATAPGAAARTPGPAAPASGTSATPVAAAATPPTAIHAGGDQLVSSNASVGSICARMAISLLHPPRSRPWPAPSPRAHQLCGRHNAGESPEKNGAYVLPSVHNCRANRFYCRAANGCLHDLLRRPSMRRCRIEQHRLTVQRIYVWVGGMCLWGRCLIMHGVEELCTIPCGLWRGSSTRVGRGPGSIHAQWQCKRSSTDPVAVTAFG